MRIYNWFCKQRESTKHQIVKIPIQIVDTTVKQMPVHQKNHTTDSLSQPLISALGGVDNIESCHAVPNSKRIRLTLSDPNLVDSHQLRQIETRLFIRIGKKIVHIIP